MKLEGGLDARRWLDDEIDDAIAQQWTSSVSPSLPKGARASEDRGAWPKAGAAWNPWMPFGVLTTRTRGTWLGSQRL